MLWILCVLLPAAPLGAEVTCVDACGTCRRQPPHLPPELLDVYCAMCRECRGRRREWMERGNDFRRRPLLRKETEATTTACPPLPHCDDLPGELYRLVPAGNTTAVPGKTTETCPPAATSSPVTCSPATTCAPAAPVTAAPSSCVQNPSNMICSCQPAGNNQQQPAVNAALLQAANAGSGAGQNEPVYFYIGIPKNMQTLK